MLFIVFLGCEPQQISQGSPDREDITEENKECGISTERFVANFKSLVQFSQRTLMVVAVTYNTTASTGQRNKNSQCLLAIKR
jgi:hypothetical protein